jgi:hypothetical protein
VLDGLWLPAEDFIVHDRIHVIPRERDLGFVVSKQDILVEIWNAYLSRAMIMDEIQTSGPAGIEIIDHLGQPAHFPASQSEIYTVKLLLEGDPNIDNWIAWVFLGVDPDGTNLHLVGFRIIPWVFNPNTLFAIVETFGYMTDVLTAFAGMEQRIQLRAVPIGSISYTATFTDKREAQMAAAILFGNQPRAFGVARWQFRRFLTAPAAADAEIIYLDTTNAPFEVGGLMFLWRDPFTWEAQTILEVHADHLVLEVGLNQSWAAGVTWVVPMVIARLSPDEALTWENLLIASAALTFDVDGFTP